MTLYFNNKKSKYLYYNGKKIKEAYYNGDKVYSSVKPLYYCYKLQIIIDVFVYYYTDFLVQSPGNVTLYYAYDNLKANSSTDLVYTTSYTVDQVDTNGNFNQVYLRSSEDDLYN